MRKNAKGFTLIELLAVIVILAIIALITVPTVLNIIDNAKKGAAVDSAYGVKKAADYYYLEQISSNASFAGMECYYDATAPAEAGEGAVACNTVLTLGGTLPTAGTITVSASGAVNVTGLTINTYELTYTAATGAFAAAE